MCKWNLFMTTYLRWITWKKIYSFFFWRLTVSYVTLMKLFFSHLSFIGAGKGSNINSLPLLHYHQNISSSIQDPNPKQGKIFLRLRTCFFLILFLALHETVLTLGKHSSKLITQCYHEFKMKNCSTHSFCISNN